MAIAIAFTATSSISSGTSHQLTLPATINANDLLIAIGCVFGTGIGSFTTVQDSTSDLWTVLHPFCKYGGTAPGQCNYAIYYKWADGDEDSGDIDFTSDASGTGCGIVARITGANSATNPEISPNMGINGPASVECEEVIASWGAETGNSFIAMGTAGDDNETFDTDPTSYTGITAANTNSGSSSTSMECGASYRLAYNSASDRASSFGLSAGEVSKGHTIVIRAS